MADPWDDPGIWNPPTTPVVDPGTPAPAAPADPNAPAASNLKAKSWGDSSSGSGMPDWFNNWFQNFFTSQAPQGQSFREAPPPDQNNGGWAGPYSDKGNQRMSVPGGEAFTGATGSPTPGGAQGSQGTQGFNMLQNAFNQYFSGGPRYQGQTDQMVGNLGDVWKQQQQLPGQIETQRQNMINQLYAGLPRMQELYQPAMESMSQRGILNSDITGNALAEIQDKVNQGLLQGSAAANTWAGGQNIDATKSMPQTLQGIISTLLGAQNNYANFGKDAMGAGTSYQTLINQMLDMLKQSQSKQNTGSETYNV